MKRIMRIIFLESYTRTCILAYETLSYLNHVVAKKY